MYGQLGIFLHGYMWLWSVRYSVRDMVSHCVGDMHGLYVHHHGYGQLGIYVLHHGYGVGDMVSHFAWAMVSYMHGYMHHIGYGQLGIVFGVWLFCMAICAPPWLRSVRHCVGDMVSHFAWLVIVLGICHGLYVHHHVHHHGYMCTTMVSHFAWLYVHHHGYGQLGIVLGIWLVILHGYMCTTMAMVS